MKKYFQYIIIFLFTLNFFISVVGIDVYHHICGKTGEHIISLITVPSCSNHIYSDNCKNNVYHCSCHQHNQSCNNKNSHHSHSEDVYHKCSNDLSFNNSDSENYNICRNYFTHIKITNDYLIQEFNKILNVDKFFTLNFYSINNSIYKDRIKLKNTLSYKIFKPPIKELISYIHFITSLSSDSSSDFSQ